MIILHFIRHGDTLQSIAEQINLENPLYIKEFHNSNCAGQDYIVEHLVAGKKLFLPDHFTVQQYNSRNDAVFKSVERNPKIIFNPENDKSEYQVHVTESSFSDGIKTENSFSYQFSLQWIKNEFSQHTFTLSKNYFSNQKETKIGDLAIASIQAVSPIEICTDSKGEILTVALLKETFERFPEIKEKLLDQFPDQYARIYIEEFEYVVHNQELFQKKMKEDWLIKTYFANIRNDFKDGKSHFRMIPENQSGEIIIEQTAAVSENADELILYQSSPAEISNFAGKYIVSKTDGTIKELEVSHSYTRYNVLYSTDFKLNKLI